ncbi:unnamed protein product [Bursaphelenchus xylophilus]|uniref:(pine wood nematode) hypothetical protein n=1 Tax=Bursaphelenchus xylophilus TaxID=6326 RepID=A0A811KF42_BURXY|nr:unnamed protein product [Bursaphelenchus xylophilus]CAG9094171.1 unnamed protein product [Bursaphelenchus xylophilus]
MDVSMEAGPSRSDAKTDSPPIDVSPEKELMEKRKKGVEREREKLDQRKQMKIRCRDIVLNTMDESMEAGPSRSDTKTDSLPIDVSPEKELMEKREEKA